MIALGVNDVTSGMSKLVWLRRQAALHRLLRQKFGVRHIYVSGLPPVAKFPLLPRLMQFVLGAEAVRFDAALEKLAIDQSDMTHVAFDLPFDPDLMATDGFHPGPDVYRAWAEILADLIIRDFELDR